MKKKGAEKKNSINPEEIPGGLNKYEEVIANFLWIAMLFVIVADMVTSYVIGQVEFHQSIFIIQTVAFILIIATGIYSVFWIKSKEIRPGWSYSLLKILDVVLIILFLSTMRYGFYFYFLVLVPITTICITRGFSVSIPFLGVGFVVHSVIYYLVMNFSELGQVFFTDRDYHIFYLLIAQYIVFAFFLQVLGIFNNQFRQGERDNQNLVAQLGRKYAQLEEARIEKQEQYDKLKEVNQRLEDSNKRLTSSLAEFFTLQQISQAISSIFDMKELLKFVNDIIIGVMGVSTSNIALYSSSGDRLKVQVSNIIKQRDLAILTDNINCTVLKNAIDEGRSIIDNAVNPDEYDFTRGRNVKSLMCVPLQVKGKAHGLVLIEHNIPDAFGSDNVRLLEIITQQVSIAIENASLYEQLQEYANTDGLTQVYNRIFFQKRLHVELQQAQQQGYEVSVILYDIDNFKLFNDSYGHLFGDIVLKSIANVVKESVRKEDIVARFGGEEFIILMSHTGREQAYEKAEELRQKIASLNVQDSHVSASVTVSIGVSTFPELAQTEESLVNSADDALYVAKGSGKNCVKIATVK